MVSHFTKVPIVDSLELLSSHWRWCPGIVQTRTNIHIVLFWWSVLRTNWRSSNRLTTLSGNCEFLHGEFEKKALKQTAHKPECWYGYVGDTFVVWPHGQEKVTEFLNHLNGTPQFTMEKEEEGHVPFLDIDIYRKTEGSLGQEVYRKPTHTSLYLHQNSHHHPANKQSVLASMIHKANALCDQNSFTQELEFLATVFKGNKYSPQQTRRTMKPATQQIIFLYADWAG